MLAESLVTDLEVKTRDLVLECDATKSNESDLEEGFTIWDLDSEDETNVSSPMSVEEMNLEEEDTFFRLKSRKVRPFYDPEPVRPFYDDEPKEEEKKEEKEEFCPKVREEVFYGLTFAVDPTAQETIDAVRVAVRRYNNKKIIAEELELKRVVDADAVHVAGLFVRAVLEATNGCFYRAELVIHVPGRDDYLVCFKPCSPDETLGADRYI